MDVVATNIQTLETLQATHYGQLDPNQMMVRFHSVSLLFDRALLHAHPATFAQIIENAILQHVLEQSQSRSVAPPPTTPAPASFGVARFFKKGWKDDYPPRCSICLDEFKSREKIRTLHSKSCTFHQRCIRKWFKTQNRCPNCNVPCVELPPPVQGYSTVDA